MLLGQKSIFLDLFKFLTVLAEANEGVDFAELDYNDRLHLLVHLKEPVEEEDCIDSNNDQEENHLDFLR